MTFHLPEVKVQKVLTTCKSALCEPGMTARHLASLLGTLESCRLAIRSAPLHFRALQILLIQTLKDHQFNSKFPIILNSLSREELSWWITSLRSVNGSPITPPAPDLTILSDASKVGWGASCQGRTTNGKWSSQESTQHINLLELKAAFLAVHTFVKDQSHKVIWRRMDKLRR